MIYITGTTFNDLNDYVILQILLMESLSLMDLCSLAETCTRLKRLVEPLFPSEFGIRAESVHKYQIESESFPVIDGTADDVERILKNFGSRLSTLSVKRNDVLLHMAAKYCGDEDGTLTKMEMIKLKNGPEPKFEPIFRRLQDLRIIDCEFINCTASPADINFDSLTR